MTVNGTRALTYVDLLKGLNPQKGFDHRAVDLCIRANEMLDDITVVEANNGTSLETTIRTGIPKPVWTTYYGGIPSNKGSKGKIKATCGRMGTKLLIDKELFDKAAGVSAEAADALLADELQSAQSGMKLEMGNMLINGTLADNPLGFNGLMKHYDAYSTGEEGEDKAAHYVLNAFGAGQGAKKSSEDKLGSILLVGWSPNTITCFHPQGANQTGGIDVKERRTTDVHDTDAGADATYAAYIQYIYWTLGLAVRDFRYGGRICNIQRDDILNGSDKGQSYIELIDRLATRVYDDNGVKQAWYMDKGMWEYVCTLFSRMTRANAITFQNVEGRKERKLFGIPVRLQEAMRINEEKVAAYSA